LTVLTGVLVVLAVAFAWSMGAHYTGACMGMPYALRAVTARHALFIMAPLSLLGAAVASHGVADTVGHRLLIGHGLAVGGQIIVLAVAFALTTVFNRLRIPTSTIQILIFSVAGTAIGAGLAVNWSTIAVLAVIWVVAPCLAGCLGYLLTRLLDLVPAVRVETAIRRGPESETATPPDPGAIAGPSTAGPHTDGRRPPAGPMQRLGAIGAALVLVGAIASFAMGANDVANATGSLVGTGTLTPVVAGLVGGGGLALGVITWGRPLLSKLAFDIVRVDRPMATAAQLVQGLVVLAAVTFGYLTSMNQALVGAMVGAGAARGRRTVNRASVLGILRGWIIGPGAGLVATLVVSVVVGSSAVAG
jgi:PiT family inorganic phosphate transporter